MVISDAYLKIRKRLPSPYRPPKKSSDQSRPKSSPPRPQNSCPQLRACLADDVLAKEQRIQRPWMLNLLRFFDILANYMSELAHLPSGVRLRKSSIFTWERCRDALRGSLET